MSQTQTRKTPGYDYQETLDKVLTTHARKESQLEALEHELGLYFNEEQVKREAEETIKGPNVDNNSPTRPKISVESIVAKARKEHRRKVSQFGAIKADIGQYLPKEEAGRFAREVMKEYNPNNRSGKPSQIIMNEIVDRAMNEHQRRKSQMMAIKNDLGLIFDKDDVNAITKNVMKKMFAQKHRMVFEKNRDDNIAISNLNELEQVKFFILYVCIRYICYIFIGDIL